MIRKLLTLLLLMGAMAFAEGRVYELRTYTCFDGKLDALKARFRDHTIRIFKKHDMQSVGYWVPEDPEHALRILRSLPDGAGWNAFRDALHCKRGEE